MNTEFKPIGMYDEMNEPISAGECLEKLHQSMKRGKPITCKVLNYDEENKHILIEYGGIPGIIRNADKTKTYHLTMEYMKGKTTKVLVRDVDFEEKKFRASRIEVEKLAEEYLSSLTVGDTIDGIVKEIRDDYGCAFIDLAEGISAYLNISEITTMPNTSVDVSDLLRIGQIITCKIIKVPHLKAMKHSKARIHVSVLQLEERFEEVCEKYALGTYYSGRPCEDRMMNNVYYIKIDNHTYITFNTSKKVDLLKNVTVKIKAYDYKNKCILASYRETDDEKESKITRELSYVTETEGSMFSREIKSNVSPFAVRENEDKRYESDCEPVSMNKILSKYKDGGLTETHTNLLRIINILGYCTSKQILSYAYSNNIPLDVHNRDKLTARLNRLEKNGLIEIGKFQSKEEVGIYRIFCISKNGKQFLKNYLKDRRKNHNLNMKEDESEWIKRILAGNQFALACMEKISPMCTYHLQEIFSCRSKVAIRPTLTLEYENSFVFLEVVRRCENWKDDLLNKANRYQILLDDINNLNMRRSSNPDWIKTYKDSHIILIGEDQEHIKECYEILQHLLLVDKLFYTFDLLLFRNDFEFSIYREDKATGILRYYSIPDLILDGVECFTSKSVKKYNISNHLFNRFPENWLRQMLNKNLQFNLDEVKSVDNLQNLELLRRGQYQEFLISSSISRNKEDAEVLWEPRLFFFGNGGSGKTSLIKLLAGEPFDSQEQKTDGVQVHPNLLKQLPWMNMGEKRIGHISVWDFAGQECDYALTNFLITDAVLCVVVVDSRSEDYPDEWLNYIQMYAPRARVLLVVNKMDAQNEISHDENCVYYNRLNIPKYLKKYPNIVDVYSISCKQPDIKGNELGKLKRHICDQILEMRELFENTWAKGINELKDWMRNYDDGCIRKKDFIKKHAALGLNEKVDAEKTLNLCVQAGLCIYHRKMKNYIVLKPQWLTSALAKLLKNQKFKERKWQLSEDEIITVIESEDGSNYYPYRNGDGLEVLELMQILDICVQYQKEYIFPCFLPYSSESKSVEEILEESEWFEIELRYSCLLPSVFTELQAKLWEYKLDGREYEPDKSKIVIRINNRRMIIYKKRNSIFLAVEKKYEKLCEEEKQSVNYVRMKLDEINKNHKFKISGKEENIQECVVLRGFSNDLVRQTMRLPYPKAFIKKICMMGIKEQYFPEVDKWYDVNNLLTEEYTEDAIMNLYESYIVVILQSSEVAEDSDEFMLGNGFLLPYMGKWYVICCAHQVLSQTENLYVMTKKKERIPIKFIDRVYNEQEHHSDDIAVFEILTYEGIERIMPYELLPFSTRIYDNDELFCQANLNIEEKLIIKGMTLISRKDEFMLCNVKDVSSRIVRGMSGTPVLDLNNRHVVGMVRSGKLTDSERMIGVVSMDCILMFLQKIIK